MKYIDGQVPKPGNYADLAANWLPILMQFKAIQSHIPEAIGGGPARGIFGKMIIHASLHGKLLRTG